jgi:hypothetical protein
MQRPLKLLFYALDTFFVTNSSFAPFWAPRNHLSLQAAISQYCTSTDAWTKREKEECQAPALHDVFMAQLEQKSSARVFNFDADAFDIASGNCASKTSTPYLSDLFESIPIENAALDEVSKSTVTHIGKARYIYMDNKGREITIDDYEVLVCPGLSTQIVSIPNWASQMGKLHGAQDKTRVTSYGNVTYIYTNSKRSKRTIAHQDKQGIPILQARLAEDSSYSTNCGCFPCYNMNIVSDDRDSDYHVQDLRRNKRHRERPTTPGQPKATSFSTAGSNPYITISKDVDPKDLLMAYHVRLGHLPFDRIQLAAKQGILPNRIAKCHAPKRASCLFDKAKRRLGVLAVVPAKLVEPPRSPVTLSLSIN